MATDTNTLSALRSQINIAVGLDEETRNKIAGHILTQIEADDQSRQQWLESSKEAIELAAQVRKEKSFPWPKASNVKYPLLTIASTQFHARAQQSLINEAGLVQAKIIGRDPDGLKKAAGNRSTKYMSYQLTEKMEDWVDDMDRLLFILPICGICYKKTYYSPGKGDPVSELVLPQDLIINYYAKNYLDARKTHIIELDRNKVFEYVNQNIYLDEDLGSPNAEDYNQRKTLQEVQKVQPVADEEDVPYTFYESHAWYDLDEDGYKEPYIITINKDSGKLVRIVARWPIDGEVLNETGNLVKLIPTEHFTPFKFMPDPMSATHGIGLGHILGSMNHSVNTLINQLIDSGTLSNLQSGFLGRGMRLPMGGTIKFKPGEWKSFQSTGDDLRKNIFPLPVKEPSNVLFQLLGLLIQSGENVGSIADIMLGENPGQNQPYSTTLAVIEQGQKVFVAIYKRLYRSLTKEYKKLFALNSVFVDIDEYSNVLDDPNASQGDWDMSLYDVAPAADPSVVSDLQKLKINEGIMALAAQGLVNPQEATKRFLEAMGVEDIGPLLELPPPQPDFDQQAKLEEIALKREALQSEAFKDVTQGMKNIAAAEKENVESEFIPTEVELKQVSTALDQYLKARESTLNEDQTERDNELREREIEAKRATPNAGNN